MPSQRKQINVRVDEETESRLVRLQAAASAALGLQLSASDVFRLALLELEKKYPGVDRETAKKAGGRKK